MNRLDEYSKKFMKKTVPDLKIGDTVDVLVKIKADAGKERRQTFNGIVIALSGHGLDRTFCVRRIVQGEGVERIFPIHSPRIVTVNIKKRGKTRRAKLYFLRDRIGKATKLKEKIWLAEDAKEAALRSSRAAQEMEQG